MRQLALAAQYLNCSVFDLLERPVAWREMAFTASVAEAEAARS